MIAQVLCKLRAHRSPRQPLNAATSRHNCHVLSQTIIWTLLRKEGNSSLKQQGEYFRKQNTIGLHGAWPLGFYSLIFVVVVGGWRGENKALVS